MWICTYVYIAPGRGSSRSSSFASELYTYMHSYDTYVYVYTCIYIYIYIFIYHLVGDSIAQVIVCSSSSAAIVGRAIRAKKNRIWRDNSPSIGIAFLRHSTHRLMSTRNRTYVATAPPKVLPPAALDRSSEGQLAAFHQSWHQPQSPSQSVVHRGESATLHARSPQSESVVAGELSQQAHRKGELTSWDCDKKAMYGPHGELDRATPNEGRWTNTYTHVHAQTQVCIYVYTHTCTATSGVFSINSPPLWLNTLPSW